MRYVVSIVFALGIFVVSSCAKKSATCRKYESCCEALSKANIEGVSASCDSSGRDDTTCQNDYFAMVGKARTAQLKDRSLKLPPACP